MREYLKVSCALFAVVTFGHLLRVLARLPLVIGGRPLPAFASLVVAIGSGAMTMWAWRLLRTPQAGPQPPAIHPTP
jgi:hypothetical protein